MRNGITIALRSELRDLRTALRSLDMTLRKAIAAKDGEPPARPRRRMSAKTRASLLLQGRYMGFMRQLKPRQKAQVRKVRSGKGVVAAIARAKVLAGAAK